MVRTLSIRNFRGFEQFEMRDLGRVNLLVGTNNSGKTSVLEAIELLCSRGDIRAIWAAAFRRGEMLSDEGESRTPEADIRQAFRGRQIDAGIAFTISAERNGDSERLRVSAEERHEDDGAEPESAGYWDSGSSASWAEPLDLEFHWGGGRKFSHHSSVASYAASGFELGSLSSPPSLP